MPPTAAQAIDQAGTPAADPTQPTVPSAEQQVDDIAAMAAQLVSPFLHSIKAVNGLSVGLQVAPLAIHFAFAFGHLFAGWIGHKQTQSAS